MILLGEGRWWCLDCGIAIRGFGRSCLPCWQDRLDLANVLKDAKSFPPQEGTGGIEREPTG